MNLNIAIFLSLFLFSVATLLLAIFGDANQTFYTVATVAGHIGLVGFGFFYASKKQESFIRALRDDLRNL